MSVTKPATFDPLDAPLWEGYDYYQSLADSVRADAYQYHIWVDPKHWIRHQPPTWVFKLEWNTYRYSRIDTVDKLKAVATKNSPGIYIFSVKPDLPINGFPAYALYVGISNARGSRRPVRERLADYLPTRIKTIRKRNKIHRMVCQYFRVLWVHFAYVNKPSSTILQIEEKLHGFLAPPVAQAAYPVDMKARTPAW